MLEIQPTQAPLGKSLAAISDGSKYSSRPKGFFKNSFPLEVSLPSRENGCKLTRAAKGFSDSQRGSMKYMDSGTCKTCHEDIYTHSANTANFLASCAKQIRFPTVQMLLDCRRFLIFRADVSDPDRQLDIRQSPNRCLSFTTAKAYAKAHVLTGGACHVVMCARSLFSERKRMQPRVHAGSFPSTVRGVL